MEKKDLLSDGRENTHSTFADRQIWKKDKQRRLIALLGGDEVVVKHEFEQKKVYLDTKTKT